MTIHRESYKAGLRMALEVLELNRLPGKALRAADAKRFREWLIAVTADEDDLLSPNKPKKAEIWKQERGGRWVCKKSSLTSAEFMRYRRAAQFDGHDLIEFKGR